MTTQQIYVSDTADPNIPIPFLCTTLTNTVVDGTYTTVLQAGLDNRIIAYPRVKALGSPYIHSTSGPVQISVQGFLADLDSRVLKAATQLRHEFPFNMRPIRCRMRHADKCCHGLPRSRFIYTQSEPPHQYPGDESFPDRYKARRSCFSKYPICSQSPVSVSGAGRFIFPRCLPSNQVQYTPSTRLKKLSCRPALWTHRSCLCSPVLEIRPN